MKATKRIFAFILVVCMLSSMLMITSCNKDKGNNNNENDNQSSQNIYTVTVLDNDGNPITGVAIMNSVTLTTDMTDANGKVTFESETPDVKVMITAVPSGYEKPKSEQISFPAGSKNLTLTVQKVVVVDDDVEYTVTVKDQNGDAVEGVKVQLCHTACIDTVTGADGVGTLKVLPGVDYDVHILEVPAGYTVAEDFEDKIPAGDTSIEITITKN